MNGKNLKYFVMGAAIVAAGLGAFAITLPATFTSGEVLSAAKLNQYFAAIKTAIDALEAPAARPSAGSRTITWTVFSSITPSQIARFSVNAPGPGRLIVQVSGQATLVFVSPNTTGSVESFSIGLCDATATSAPASCDDTYQRYESVDPDNAENGNMSQTFVLERTVNITAAGARTFFLNGQISTPLGEAYNLKATRVNVLFIPAANDMTISQP